MWEGVRGGGVCEERGEVVVVVVVIVYRRIRPVATTESS